MATDSSHYFKTDEWTQADTPEKRDVLERGIVQDLIQKSPMAEQYNAEGTSDEWKTQAEDQIIPKVREKYASYYTGFKPSNQAPAIMWETGQQIFPTKHPFVANEDGSHSNVILGGYEINGREYVIPSMVDGEQLTPAKAVALAKQNGLEKYPSFSTVDAANEFAETYHGRIDENGKLKSAPAPASGEVQVQSMLTSEQWSNETVAGRSELERELSRTQIEASPIAKRYAALGPMEQKQYEDAVTNKRWVKYAELYKDTKGQRAFKFAEFGAAQNAALTASEAAKPDGLQPGINTRAQATEKSDLFNKFDDWYSNNVEHPKGVPFLPDMRSLFRGEAFTKDPSAQDIEEMKQTFGIPRETEVNLQNIFDMIPIESMRSKQEAYTQDAKRLNSWQNDFDTMFNAADDKLVEASSKDLGTLETSMKLARKAAAKRTTRGGPNTTVIVDVEGDAKAIKEMKRIYGEDVDVTQKLIELEGDYEVAMAEVSVNLVAAAHRAGRQPSITASFKRTGLNPGNYMPIIRNSHKLYQATEANSILEKEQRFLQNPDENEPISRVEQARLSTFLADNLAEEAGDRGPAKLVRQALDMIPYAFEFALARGATTGLRKKLVGKAVEGNTRRLLGHIGNDALQAAVATTFGIQSSAYEAEKKRLNRDAIKIKFDSEEGQLLRRYVEGEGAIIDHSQKIFWDALGNSYIDAWAESGTERFFRVSGKVGRTVAASRLMHELPHLRPNTAEKILGSFASKVADGPMAKKLGAISRWTKSKPIASRTVKAFQYAGVNNPFGELMEEAEGAMLQSLFQFGVADEDKDMRSIVQRVLDPRSWDPTRGGNKEDWIAMVGAFGAIPLAGAAATGGQKLVSILDTKLTPGYVERGRQTAIDRYLGGLTGATAEQRKVETSKELDALEERLKGERKKEAKKYTEAKWKYNEKLDELADVEHTKPKAAEQMAKIDQELKVLSRKVAEARLDFRAQKRAGDAYFKSASKGFTSNADRVARQIGRLQSLGYDGKLISVPFRLVNRLPMSKKGWDKAIELVTTGLAPLSDRRKADAAIAEIYAAVRPYGKNKVSRAILNNRMLRYVTPYLKHIVQRNGGTLRVARMMAKAAPQFAEYMQFGELATLVHDAEKLAKVEMNEVVFDTPDKQAGFIRKAGIEALTEAIRKGFLPIAEVDSQDQRDLLNSFIPELKRFISTSDNKTFAALPSSVWDKATKEDKAQMAKALVVMLDAKEEDSPLSVLERNKLASFELGVGEGQLTVGPLVKALLAILSGGTSNKQNILLANTAKHFLQEAYKEDTPLRINVIPRSLIVKAYDLARSQGHLGDRGANTLITKAFNIGNEIFITPDATALDLVEEMIEMGMKANGFFSMDGGKVAEELTELFFQGFLRKMRGELATNSQGDEINEDTLAKMPVAAGRSSAMNEAKPNSISRADAIEAIDALLVANTPEGRTKLLFEFLSSIYTINGTAAQRNYRSKAASVEYASRPDVARFLTVYDVLAQDKRSKDAFINFMQHTTELFFPEEARELLRADPLAAKKAVQDPNTGQIVKKVPTPRPTRLDEMLSEGTSDKKAEEWLGDFYAEEIAAETKPVDYQAEASRLGIEFEGMQEQFEAPALPMFSADEKAVTFVVPEGKTVEETLTERRADQEKKAEPKPKPVEAPKEEKVVVAPKEEKVEPKPKKKAVAQKAPPEEERRWIQTPFTTADNQKRIFVNFNRLKAGRVDYAAPVAGITDLEFSKETLSEMAEGVFPFDLKDDTGRIVFTSSSLQEVIRGLGLTVLGEGVVRAENGRIMVSDLMKFAGVKSVKSPTRADRIKAIQILSQMASGAAKPAKQVAESATVETPVAVTPTVEILSAEAFDDSKDFVKYLEGLPEGALVNQTVSVFDFGGNLIGTVLEDTTKGLIIDVLGTGKHTSERRLIVDIPLGKKTPVAVTPTVEAKPTTPLKEQVQELVKADEPAPMDVATPRRFDDEAVPEDTPENPKAESRPAKLASYWVSVFLDHFADEANRSEIGEAVVEFLTDVEASEMSDSEQLDTKRFFFQYFKHDIGSQLAPTSANTTDRALAALAVRQELMFNPSIRAIQSFEQVVGDSTRAAKVGDQEEDDLEVQERQRDATVQSGDERAKAEMFSVLKNLNLHNKFGPDFVASVMQNSVAMPQALKEAGEAMRPLILAKAPAEEIYEAARGAIHKYLYGSDAVITPDERALVAELRRLEQSGNLFTVGDMTDLYVTYEEAYTRPVFFSSSRIDPQAGFDDLGQPIQGPFKLYQYKSNAEKLMGDALYANLGELMDTPAKMKRMFQMLGSISQLGREDEGKQADQVYSLWSTLLSIPADMLKAADTVVSEKLTVNSLVIKTAFQSKGSWAQVADARFNDIQTYRDEGRFSELHQEILAAFIDNGVMKSVKDKNKLKGANTISQLAAALPIDANQSTIRRLSGEQKNVRTPFSHATRRFAEMRIASDVEGEWRYSTLDMFERQSAQGSKYSDPREISEEVMFKTLYNAWLSSKELAPTWVGAFGDKELVSLIDLPKFKTLSEAKAYHNDVLKGSKERGFEPYPAKAAQHLYPHTAEEVLESLDSITDPKHPMYNKLYANHLKGRGRDNFQTFIINDLANRMRIMAALYDDPGKFGKPRKNDFAEMLNKRNAMAASSGYKAAEQIVGKNKLNAVTIVDPEIRTAAARLLYERERAQLQEQSKSRDPSTAEQALESLKELESSDKVELTDGFALVADEMMDLLQYAWGPNLTKTKQFGDLKVLKALRAGFNGNEKFGAARLNKWMGEQEDSSAYKIIWDAVQSHQKATGQTIDIIFFSSADKSGSENDVHLFDVDDPNKISAKNLKEGYQFDKTHEVPLTDFYWLLQAGHTTNPEKRTMSIQLPAVMAQVSLDAYHDITGYMDYFIQQVPEKLAEGASLEAGNVVREGSHLMLPLVQEGELRPNNIWMRDTVASSRALAIRKKFTPEVIGHQLVEWPIAAESQDLPGYQMVSQPKGDTVWPVSDAPSTGGRVRLALANYNSDSSRATMTMDDAENNFSAKTPEEARQILLRPALFPFFIDLFDIPRETVSNPDALKALMNNPSARSGLPLRSFEMTFKNGNIILPGTPSIVQRVPSDGSYSASVVRLNQRLINPKDNSAANAIQTDTERNVNSGSDFDIDKRFVLVMSRSTLSAEAVDKLEKKDPKAWAIIKQTFHIPKDVPADQKNVGYGGIQVTGRMYEYNKMMLNLLNVFDDQANLAQVNLKMDHSLTDPLIAKARARLDKEKQGTPYEMPGTIFGAINGYKANSVGQQGLGRVATAMYATNIMGAEGIGFTASQSFDFAVRSEIGDSVPGDVLEIKLNRLTGSGASFLNASAMIGLILNKFTDHAKMQEIDKIGGNEVTAPLFALLLYGNADITGDVATNPKAVAYMETVWKFLMSPEVQAWVELEQQQAAITGSRIKPENLQKVWAKTMGRNGFPVKTPQDQENATNFWETIVPALEELRLLEKSLRGWYKAPALTQEGLSRRREEFDLTTKGYKARGEHKVSMMFQHPWYFGKAETRQKPVQADSIPPVYGSTLISYNTQAKESFKDLPYRSGTLAELSFDVFDKEFEVSGKKKKSVPPFQSDDNLQILHSEMLRWQIAEAVIRAPLDGVPYDLPADLNGLAERIFNQIGEYQKENAAKGINQFLLKAVTASVIPETVEKGVTTPAQFSVLTPSSMSARDLAPETMTAIHTDFRSLPEALQRDLMMYALTQYGPELHSGFGSYLAMMDTGYLAAWDAPASAVDAQMSSGDYTRGLSLDPLTQHIQAQIRSVKAGKRPLELSVLKAVTVDEAGMAFDPTLPQATRAVADKAQVKEYENVLTFDEIVRLKAAGTASVEEIEKVPSPEGKEAPEATETNPFDAGDHVDTFGMTQDEYDIYDFYKDKPMSEKAALNREFLESLQQAAEARGETFVIDADVRQKLRAMHRMVNKFDALVSEEDQAPTPAQTAFAEYADQVDLIKTTVRKGKIAQVQRQKAADTAYDNALFAGLEPGQLKRLEDSIDNIEEDGGATMSAILTEVIELAVNDTVNKTNANHSALLRSTRMLEALGIRVRHRGDSILKMVRARPGHLHKLATDERPGETLMKAITVLLDNGIHTQAQLDRLSKATKKKEFYYWDESDDITAVLRRDGTPTGKFAVPRAKRKSVADAIAIYEAERKRINEATALPAFPKSLRDPGRLNRKYQLPHWEEVLAEVSSMQEEAREGLNNVMGYDWIPKGQNPISHMVDAGLKQARKQGRISADNVFAFNPTPNQADFASRMISSGSTPTTWDVMQNFELWFRAATETARAESVMKQLSLMTDSNGMPGLIVATPSKQEAKGRTPYSVREGFKMLDNLHAVLSRLPSSNLNPVQRADDPAPQIETLIRKNKTALRSLGYVEVLHHTLGPGIETVWVQRGTNQRIFAHIGGATYGGRLREAISVGSPSMIWWGLVTAVLQTAHLLKAMAVGFSFFHHVALMESAVANEASIGNSLFPPATYVMLGVKGIQRWREMSQDPRKMASWAEHGLKASTLPADALYVKTSDNALGWLGNFLRDSNIKGFHQTRKLGQVVLWASNMKTRFDNLLWHGMLPTMKVNMAEQMFQKFRARPDMLQLTDAQIKNDIAMYVNDALGGQEWEQYLRMTPMWQNFWNMIMFAPDWTLSALNVSGLPSALQHLTGITGRHHNTYKDSFISSPLSKQRTRYLMGFAYNVFVIYPLMLQSLVYATAGGGDDPDDEKYFWNNTGAGKWGRPDVTPLIRKYREWRGITEPLGQRVLLTPGKQIREVARWVTDFGHTFWGKTSGAVKLAHLLSTKSRGTPVVFGGDPDMPFTVEGKEFYKEISSHFTPFLARPFMSGREVDKQVPWFFRLALPVKRGTSNYQASKQVTELLLKSAKLEGRVGRMNPVERSMWFEKELGDIATQARVNGLDLRKVMGEGRRGARAELQKTFTQELVSSTPDMDKMMGTVQGLLFFTPEDEEGFKEIHTLIKRRMRESMTPAEASRARDLVDSYEYEDTLVDAKWNVADDWDYPDQRPFDPEGALPEQYREEDRDPEEEIEYPKFQGIPTY